MSAKQVVRLTDDERRRCRDLVGAGQGHARAILHAQVLLRTDAGPGGPGWTDKAIAEALGTTPVTVATIRKTMLREGLASALQHYHTPEGPRPHKVDGDLEAHLVALACGEPPDGQKRWSLRLLASRAVELGYVDSISHTLVASTLKKTNCSLGASCAGASPARRTPPS
jgi:hypothetical protein